MKKVRRDDEIVPLEKHSTFYAVAYTSFLRAKDLAKKRDSYKQVLKGRKATEADQDFLAINRAAEERSAVVTVIFSALTLEAFINDYAIIDKFSRAYVDKYLDTLSPRGKWLIFPLLHVGDTFSTDGQTFQMLTELFHLRNELVHFKSRKKLGTGLRKYDQIAMKDASDAVRTVRTAVAELKRIDERVTTRWLSEVEKTPVE